MVWPFEGSLEGEDDALTYPDLAQTLQNRIIASVKAGNVPRHPVQLPDRDGNQEVYIATLEKAFAEAQALSEGWRQEAETTVKRVEGLEANLAALEKAIAEAEALTEKWRDEAATVTKRVEALEANIAALEGAVTEAQAEAEKHRQDAKLAAKRVDDLVAELFELTSEHVEISTRSQSRPAGTTRIDLD